MSQSVACMREPWTRAHPRRMAGGGDDGGGGGFSGSGGICGLSYIHRFAIDQLRIGTP